MKQQMKRVLKGILFSAVLGAAPLAAACISNGDCLSGRCIKNAGAFGTGICSEGAGDAATTLPTFRDNPTQGASCSFSTDCAVGRSCVKRPYAVRGYCE